MSSTLVVNVLDLLRRPGSQKEVSVVVKAADFDFGDSRLDDAADVAVDIELESSSTGIVAHGSAQVAWRSMCRRCLRPVDGAVIAELDEAFSRGVTAAVHHHGDTAGDALSETEPIVGDQIDFTLPVREAVLLAVPEAPLCRADCPGLCPQCGADRATTKCACVTETRDERWAALDSLRGKLDDAVE
ncbi:MAG: YceD family protein [Actinomycetota bacterium]